MNTHSINIEFPADILLALNESEKELKENIKISLAIRLYTSKKLTIGKAAQIAGLSRLEFDKVLSENKIPISDLSFEDVNSDISNLL